MKQQGIKINNNIIIGILFVIIIVLSLYIIIEKAYSSMVENYEDQLEELNEQNQINVNESFENGFKAGFEQAILNLLQAGLTCEPIPVTGNNLTLNMIAVECLQAMMEQEMQQQPVVKGETIITHGEIGEAE